MGQLRDDTGQLVDPGEGRPGVVGRRVDPRRLELVDGGEEKLELADLLVLVEELRELVTGEAEAADVRHHQANGSKVASRRATGMCAHESPWKRCTRKRRMKP